MKRFLMLFAGSLTMALMLASCSLDNDPKVNFDIDFVAADSVSIPAYFKRGQSYPFTIYYKRPDDCHFDNGFYATRSGNTITIAIQNIVLANTQCNPVQSTASDVATFNFQCPFEAVDHYTFKFYKSQDTYGQDQFIEVTVPVGP
ncbi:hypothetical protein [Flavobacterium psychrotrophum]|uniref:hypothetical protein n=1 Tax=Flavobacterium psychrotrophum TaxID=2294119 RepID=UPI0013C49F32|nr:hypothetical protein [Flavobacterium psychrotrophum]